MTNTFVQTLRVENLLGQSKVYVVLNNSVIKFLTLTLIHFFRDNNVSLLLKVPLCLISYANLYLFNNTLKNAIYNERTLSCPYYCRIAEHLFFQFAPYLS